MSTQSIPVYHESDGVYQVSTDGRLIFYMSSYRIAIIATDTLSELYMWEPTTSFDTKKIYEREDGSVVFTNGHIKYCYDVASNKLICDKNPLTFCFKECDIENDHNHLFAGNKTYDEKALDNEDRLDNIRCSVGIFLIMKRDRKSNKIIFAQDNVFNFIQVSNTCVCLILKIDKGIYLRRITCDPETHKCSAVTCQILDLSKDRHDIIIIPKLEINRKEGVVLVSYDRMGLTVVNINNMAVVGQFKMVVYYNTSHIVVNTRRYELAIIDVKTCATIRILLSLYHWSSILLSGEFILTQDLSRTMLYCNVFEEDGNILKYSLKSGSYEFYNLASINNGSVLLLFGKDIEKISTAFIKHKQQKQSFLISENDKKSSVGRFMHDVLYDRHLLNEIFQFIPKEIGGCKTTAIKN
jgi:hypothetical protein